TFPLSAIETGQPSFVSSAARPKAASSMPGTCPSTSILDVVIPSPGTNVTVADVDRSVGGVPWLARTFESAIEKHAACAAAISSSGEDLPGSSPVRAAHVISSGPNVPLPTRSSVPAPVMRSPCHRACARLSAVIAAPLSPGREFHVTGHAMTRSRSRRARELLQSIDEISLDLRQVGPLVYLTEKVLSFLRPHPDRDSIITSLCSHPASPPGSALPRTVNPEAPLCLPMTLDERRWLPAPG